MACPVRVTMKVYYERTDGQTGIRRFVLDHDEACAYDNCCDLPSWKCWSYKKLVHKIDQRLPELDATKYKTYWKDEDGDSIEFSSNEEFCDALVAQPGTFRIYIRDTNECDISEEEHDRSASTIINQSADNGERLQDPASHDDNPADDVTTLTDEVISPSDDVIATGAICDCCDTPVLGVRYKCCICPDFDLCETCESRGEHSHHDMVRLDIRKHQHADEPKDAPILNWQELFAHMDIGSRSPVMWTKNGEEDGELSVHEQQARENMMDKYFLNWMRKSNRYWAKMYKCLKRQCGMWKTAAMATGAAAKRQSKHMMRHMSSIPPQKTSSAQQTQQSQADSSEAQTHVNKELVEEQRCQNNTELGDNGQYTNRRNEEGVDDDEDVELLSSTFFQPWLSPAAMAQWMKSYIQKEEEIASALSTMPRWLQKCRNEWEQERVKCLIDTDKPASTENIESPLPQNFYPFMLKKKLLKLWEASEKSETTSSSSDDGEAEGTKENKFPGLPGNVCPWMLKKHWQKWWKQQRRLEANEEDELDGFAGTVQGATAAVSKAAIRQEYSDPELNDLSNTPMDNSVRDPEHQKTEDRLNIQCEQRPVSDVVMGNNSQIMESDWTILETSSTIATPPSSTAPVVQNSGCGTSLIPQPTTSAPSMTVPSSLIPADVRTTATYDASRVSTSATNLTISTNRLLPPNQPLSTSTPSIPTENVPPFVPYAPYTGSNMVYPPQTAGYSVTQPSANGGAIYPNLHTRPEAMYPQYQTPQVQRSLEHMLAMGYKDEDGWLTHLLTLKGGNISLVLDILHPSRPQ